MCFDMSQAVEHLLDFNRIQLDMYFNRNHRDDFDYDGSASCSSAEAAANIAAQI